MLKKMERCRITNGRHGRAAYPASIIEAVYLGYSPTGRHGRAAYPASIIEAVLSRIQLKLTRLVIRMSMHTSFKY